VVLSKHRSANAADDERNPVELGIVAREIKRVKNGTYYQIPASPETNGHGTSGDAKWWKHLLPELLSDAKPGQYRGAARSPMSLEKFRI
jgi:homoserine O-acetyltransferase/O-succinyltransferase